MKLPLRKWHNVYFAKQRTWFITIQLHPPQILQSRFTSIKLFFLIYITAAVFVTLPSPNPQSPLPPTRESITDLQLFQYLVWRLALKTFRNHSLISVSLWHIFFFYYYHGRVWYYFSFFFPFFDRAENGIHIHYHSLQAPGSSSFPDDRSDLTFWRGGGYNGVYCIKMYSGFIDIHSIG